mgnify:CR=1 FL=1
MASQNNHPVVKPHPVWLCVFEVADSQVPPRFPNKPHIQVEQKSIKPGPELNTWLNKARLKKRPGLVRVLSELMPAHDLPGGLLNPFEYPRDQELIKRSLLKLREKLRCEGYTVGRSTTVWHEIGRAHV